MYYKPNAYGVMVITTKLTKLKIVVIWMFARWASHWSHEQPRTQEHELGTIEKHKPTDSKAMAQVWDLALKEIKLRASKVA